MRQAWENRRDTGIETQHEREKMTFNNFRVSLHTVVFSALIGLSGPAFAILIDFETVPGGTPSDQLAISSQYLSSSGVSFSLLNPDTSYSSPFLEAVGDSDPGYGFVYTYGPGGPTADMAAPGYESELGNYYLRFLQGDQVSVPVSQLIISYTASAWTSEASGQIWDIDAHNIDSGGGRAQWLVEAFDGSGGFLESLLSPLGELPYLPGTLDGRPWTWSFDRASADIAEIRISYTGTQMNNIGVGFDNINTHSAAVPVPAAVWLFGSSLLALAGMRKIRRAQ